jgi:hypothetical protein
LNADSHLDRALSAAHPAGGDGGIGCDAKGSRMKLNSLAGAAFGAVALAVLGFNPSVQAQTTALTYQGRLNSGGVPANGVYDLQFTLYDAGLGGNPVGSPVALAAVSVTNGLFTVALDFGSGVFTGAALWLEVGVRPTGNGSFVILAPRQGVTASPYALYAPTAGTARFVSLSAVTNFAIPPGSVSSTNVVAYSLVASNLDTPTWLGWLAGNFGAYSNWNRFGTANTSSRIRNNQAFTVLVLGDGNTLDGLPVGFYSNLTQTFGLSGILCSPVQFPNSFLPSSVLTPINYIAGNPWPGVGFNSGGCLGSGNAIWFCYYMQLTNSGAYAGVQSGFPFPSDNWEVDYVATTNGGPFLIETNAGNGWGTVASLTGYAAQETGVAFHWTNSAGLVPGTMQIMLTNTASGTNNWVGVAWNNSTVAGGVRMMVQGAQSSSEIFLRQVPERVRAPIYASWDPSLVLLCFPITWTSVNWGPDYLATVQFIRTNTPNADLVLCSEVINDTPATPWTAIQICRTNGPHCSYFDSYGMLSITNIGNGRGLFSTDGGHMTGAGYAVFSQLLWDFLDLTESH